MTTSIYAVTLVWLFLFLSVRTLLTRRKLKIGIGTGDNIEMTRAMRVHANFSEYVPLALLLMLMIELTDISELWVHLVGVPLLVGRLVHAYGVAQVEENYGFRVAGMAMTFTSLISSTLILTVSLWLGFL